MLISSVSFRSTLVALAAVAMFATSARSQVTGEAKVDKSPVLLRVICKQPVEGATDLKIVQGGKVLHDLEIVSSLMTDPLGVGRGELLLAREMAGKNDKPVFDPVLKVTIPSEGKRFVLALFAAAKPTPATPYQYRLIRTDGLHFGISDIYLFNLTNVPIGGTLGKKKFTLMPDKSEVAIPEPDETGGRIYQCSFYFLRDNQTTLFNSTRWPLSKTCRIYLFFIPDPERHSIGYQSFPEYRPFP